MNPHDDTHAAPTERTPSRQPVRPFLTEAHAYRWDDVPVLAYKPTDTHFQGVTRQVLFGEADDLTCQLRYFEIEPGGYSTLERHRHVHAVIILRGRGRVLIGETVYALQPYDLVHVPPMTWHQFRADARTPLGFLCLVPCDRDRPERPDAMHREVLQNNPAVNDFIRF